MKYDSTSKTPGVPKEDEKLFENIIDNLGKPKVKPKVKPFLTPGERRRCYAQLKKYKTGQIF